MNEFTDYEKNRTKNKPTALYKTVFKLHLVVIKKEYSNVGQAWLYQSGS